MPSRFPPMDNITAEFVRSILSYDPATGLFTWLSRPSSTFHVKRFSQERACAVWNKRFAGMVAGNALTNGYLSVKVKGRHCLAHRLAWLYMTGAWPDDEVDHRNGVVSDNRWCNLRAATPAQNKHNSSISVRNSSGAVGVSWDAINKRWSAYIRADGENHFLGRFAEKSAAIAARTEAKAKLHPFQPVQRAS